MCYCLLSDPIGMCIIIIMHFISTTSLSFCDDCPFRLRFDVRHFKMTNDKRESWWIRIIILIIFVAVNFPPRGTVQSRVLYMPLVLYAPWCTLYSICAITFSKP